jgi:hypothetical protein
MIELDNIPRRLAEEAAILIKEMNCQQAVLLQEISVMSQRLAAERYGNGWWAKAQETRVCGRFRHPMPSGRLAPGPVQPIQEILRPARPKIDCR